MAYGLKCVNANGDFVIDSDTSLLGSNVVASGSSSGVSFNSGDIVFVRPQISSGTRRTVCAERFTISGTTYYSFLGQNSDSFINADSSSEAIIVDWFKLEVFSGSVTEDYGLQVKNSDNVLTFDSRLLTNSIQASPTGFINRYALQDGDQITTDLSYYYPLQNFFADGITFEGYYNENYAGVTIRNNFGGVTRVDYAAHDSIFTDDPFEDNVCAIILMEDLNE